MPLVETERKILSVSDITKQIRFTLEDQFSNLWVEGEISGFKFHTSGHMYFTLKDETAQISAVMFRRENLALKFEPQDGLKVLCFGRVSVYPPRGQYQFYVERIEPKGVGALQLKFEELKEKLRLEGLFDPAFKKELPYLPGRIGVITSIDGAALRDILNVLDRRFRETHILIHPVPVQGADAAENIAEAIHQMNRQKTADVLIIGRGGGSLEDLWAFNEEVVARAIFASEIPVISAVGHEVDFTIADFVADLRAATPSAAAELVLPRKEDLILRLEELKARSFSLFLNQVRFLRQELESLKASRGFRDPLGFFEIKSQRLDELIKNLSGSFKSTLSLKKERFLSLVGKLEALGPLEVLKRGFSVSLKLPEESVIQSSRMVKRGDQVKTKLKEGFFISRVEEVSYEPRK